MRVLGPLVVKIWIFLGAFGSELGEALCFWIVSGLFVVLGEQVTNGCGLVGAFGRF